MRLFLTTLYDYVERCRKYVLIKADLRNATIVFVVFLALSALSYANRDVTITICAASIVLLGLLSAELVYALTLFLIPFSQYFAFNRHDTRILVAVALVTSAIRLAPYIRKHTHNRHIRNSTYTWIFLVFFILVVLHFDTSDLLLEVQGAGLLIAAFMLFFGARFLKDDLPDISFLTEFALVTGTLVSVTLSALFLYWPFPQLIIAHLPVDNLRLTGVQGGPNATARYLLPVLGCFISRALCYNQKRWCWNILLVVACVLLGATSSKAAIGGAIVMCCMAIFFTPSSIRVRSGVVSAIVALSLGLSIFALKPRIEYRAAENWQAIGNGQVHYYLETPPANITTHQIVTRDLRVGTSKRMTESPGGEIHYKGRPYSIWHTGQRDLLWRTGIAVIQDNFLWGIGYKGWEKELKKRLGFPFESPHNAFLEVTGAYGFLAGALYLLMLAAFLTNILTLKRHAHTSGTKSSMLWPVLSCTGLFTVELVDVSTSLAVTLFVVWFWLLLGLQESQVADNPS